MLPVFRIPRAAWGTRTLLCLLLLAVSLRAMIPVGYMPDTAALRQGVMRIGLCTSTGMVTVMQVLPGGAAQDLHTLGPDTHLDRDGAVHGIDGGPDHDGSHHAAGAECPFWAAAHLAVDLPPAAIMPLLAAVRDLPVRFTAPAALPPLPPAGPPLGSRAPPSA
ncbi:hypothetical protein AKI39_18055 [Bordetella sp. H567]|uniref:DUF2946 family protein n=1 Tax=Bordetella sp. H567 TaxID=1697043 RepID=UPI00081CB33F|nr:DUF2946 family protein [Bordetella sp. H567]AOB32212.1 hypothetical protein AKI39_18055 [Bordetella sp. H567]